MARPKLPIKKSRPSALHIDNAVMGGKELVLLMANGDQYVAPVVLRAGSTDDAKPAYLTTFLPQGFVDAWVDFEPLMREMGLTPVLHGRRMKQLMCSEEVQAVNNRFKLPEVGEKQ